MKYTLDYNLNTNNINYLQTKFTWMNNENIRTFSSPENAIAEAILGLAAMQPHRQNIYLHNGESPYTKSLPEFFSKKNIKINTFSVLDPEVDEDAFLYILVRDQPFSGQLFDFVSLQQKLIDKKIFFLNIYHQEFFKKDFIYEVSSYGLDAFCFNPRVALLALGTRSKKIPAALPRSEIDIDSIEVHTLAEDRLKVEQLEAQLVEFNPDIKLFFKTGDDRICDRIVFHVPQLNGEKLARYFHHYGAYTSSPCFLSHLFVLSWWKDYEESLHWLVIPIERIDNAFLQAFKDYCSSQ